MRYVDTSVLLAYLTPDEGSATAEAFMMSVGAPLAISTVGSRITLGARAEAAYESIK
jgi:predicted nucleic acid-binding protein